MIVVLWLVLLLSYISASPASWSLRLSSPQAITLVHLWVNRWAVEWEGRLLTLGTQLNSTQLVLAVRAGKLSMEREDATVAEVETEQEEGWRLVVIRVDGQRERLGLCVVGEKQGKCVQFPCVVSAESYVQVNPELALVHMELHHLETGNHMSSEWLIQEVLLWKHLNSESLPPNSHYAALTFWAKAAPFYFRAEVEVSQRPSFSITWVEKNLSAYYCIESDQMLSSSCLILDAIQQDVWRFLRVEVRLTEEPTISFCVTNIGRENTRCLVKEIEDIWGNGDISVIRPQEIDYLGVNLYDFRLWKLSPNHHDKRIFPLTELNEAFEEGKTHINSRLQHSRRLPTTHYAVFSYAVASALSDNFFSFQNTHKSTQSIVISAVSIGPVYLNIYKNYVVGDPVGWSNSAMDTCSYTLNTPPLEAAFTVNVQVSLGVPLQITVTIACNEATAACYCPVDTYPSPTTANCVACPSTDFQCKSMSDLGCLPVNIGNTGPSGAFDCKHCSSGQFGSSANGSCASCHSTCSQCVDSGNMKCSACFSHAELSIPLAISSCVCSLGYYPSPDSSNCVQCDPRCTQCSGAGNTLCSACSSNASLASTTCECNSDYGYSVTGCLSCPGLCSSCTLADSSSCLLCITNAIRVTPGAAVSACSCDSGFYLNGSVCSACDNTCVTCGGGLASECLTCPLDAGLAAPPGPSVCQCNQGFYPSTDVTNCQPCDSSCLTCSGSSASDCLSCPSHSTITGLHTCPCDSGYGRTALGCVDCPGLCLTCGNADISDCLSCRSTAILVSSPGPSACKCPSSTFLAGTGDACISCSNQCLACIGPSISECTQCQANAQLLSPPTSACSCLSSFFASPDPSLCLSCDLTCLQCTSAGPNGCSVCNSNASVNMSGSCACDDGHYPVSTVSNCQSCDSSCKSCSGPSASECLSCYSHATLSGTHTCECDSGYGTSATGCQPCTGLCLTCLQAGSVSCLSCKPGAAVATPPGVCTCQSLYYYDSGAISCPLCNLECSTCSGPLATDCLSCKLNASQLTTPGACQCDSYFYPSPDPSNCLNCDISCALCTSGGPNGCSTCPSHASLSASHSCDCDNGYGTSASGCQPCTGLCVTCSQSGASSCLTCLSGASVSASPGICTCTSGYYYDAGTLQCPACNSQCATCDGPAPTSCLTCQSHASLLSATVPNGCQCDATFYPSPDPSLCPSCHSTCALCTAGGLNGCSSCFSNASLSLGACLCVTGFYPSTTSANCQPCASTCMSCNGPTSNQCLSCFSHATLSASYSCDCDNGYGISATGCQPCTGLCQNCAQAGSSFCLTCVSGALVAAPPGICSCMNGYYFDSIAITCPPCNGECQTCSNPTNSDCLSCKGNAGPSATPPCSCKCNTGYFGSPNASNCLSCHPTCLNCTGAASNLCSACKPNAIFGGGSCPCNPSFFFNSSIALCANCSPYCLNCTADTSNDCISCRSNAVLVTPPLSSCVCAVYYFGLPNACTACNKVCKTCSGNAASQCLTCKSNATLAGSSPNTCLCNSGYYMNIVVYNCYACLPECATCVALSVNQCLTCPSNSMRTVPSIPASSCVCDSSFFPNPTVSNCSPCNISCLTCSGGANTNCLNCYTNAALTAGSCICNFGRFPDSAANNCSLCHLTCRSCSNGTDSDCSTCFSNASVVAGKCECNSNAYPNLTSSNCVLCYYSCATCSGPLATDCLSCFSNAALSAGACQCNSNAFPSPGANNCLLCDALCLTCSGSLASQCMSCYPGAILTNGNAPSPCSCPDDKFPSSTSANCQPCASSCLKCAGPNSNYCTLCRPTAQLSLGACVCLSGYYLAGSGDCALCDMSCLECSGPTSLDCTFCPVAGGGRAAAVAGVCAPCSIPTCTCDSTCANLSCSGPSAVQCLTCVDLNAGVINPKDPFNGSGRCACNAGYFPSPNATNCLQCDVTCMTCSGTTSADCLSCYTNAKLSGSSCICADTYFTTSNSANCFSCDQTCLVCTGPNSTDCSSCFTNAKLATTISPNSCICPVGYYSIGSARNCALCDPTCLTCNGSDKSQCLTCKGSALLENAPNPSACVCPSGWYLDSGTSLCVGCEGTCLTCSAGTASDCLTCYSNASLSIGALQGVCTCQNGYYPLVDSSNCKLCDASCLTCSGPTSTDCLSCYPKAVISVSTCICSPSHYTLSNTASCLACDLTCKTCSGPNNTDCTGCYTNASLTGSSCTCNLAYFPDSTSATCSSCPIDCKSCVSIDNCTVCYSNANTYTTAINTRSCRCNTGFYPDTNAVNCSACDVTCKNCSGPASNNCQWPCGNNAILVAQQCPCNAGNYRVAGSCDCSNCHSTCSSCTFSTITTCTGCKSNAALVGTAPTNCACVNGYYPSGSAANCQACQPICLLCTGVGLCSSCIVNAAVATVPGPCVCNDGFYYKSVGNLCDPCSGTCQTCSGPLATDCLTCFSNTQLTAGSCSCLPHYYPFPTAANCLQCDSSCVLCNAGGTSFCTSCASNAALIGGINPGTCLCNLNFWPNPDPGSCSPCYNTCLTCQSAASTQCLSCQLYANLSVSPGPNPCVCDIGYYLIPATGMCGSCHANCLACSSASTASNCVQCKPDASLVSGISPGTCQCNTGYYPNLTPALCSACDLTCVKCSTGGVNDCTSCHGNAAVTGAVGPCICLGTYWPNPNSSNCQPCSNTCQNCSAGDAASCTSCKSNATNSSGACNCNTGYYRDLATGNCLPCDSTCVNCTDSLPSKCSQCKTNASLVGAINPGTCACNNAYWPNATPANCSACHSTCALCVSGNTAANCTLCKANAQILGGGAMGTCTCLDGFYPNPTSANCAGCHLTCVKCSAGGIAGCKTCYSHAIIQGGGSVGICVCDTSYWPNNDSTNCLPCSNTCLDCSAADSSSCSSCKSYATLSLITTVGICNCNTGYFRDTPTGDCLPCDSTCLNCVGSLPTKCSQCKSNASLIGGINPGTCVCNSAYWPNSTSANCQACDNTCALCTLGSLGSNCTLCKTNAQILGGGAMGTCTCLDGFYPNTTAANCAGCHLTCVKCSAGGISGCKTCYNHAIIQGGGSVGICVCDTSYWPNNDSTNCLPCSNTCLDCSAADSSSCSSCKSYATLSLITTVGICNCNTGYFRDTPTGDCLPCDSTCLNCVDSLPSKCSQCKTNASLVGAINPGTCACNNAYWPNASPANCSACHSTCALCTSGSAASNCTQCKANAQIIGGGAMGTCTCLDGFYPSSTPANCVACDFTCTKCSAGGVSGCTNCYPFAIIQGGGATGKCVCAISYWPNPNFTSCQPCSNTCQECTSASALSCSICKSHATLAPGPALGSCPCNTGYFRDTPTGDCLACDPTCLNCYSNPANQCWQCKAGAQLTGGLDPSTCECQTSFFPNTTPANCVACDLTCLQCNAASISSCTVCKSNAFKVGAVGACTCNDGFWPNTTSANCVACVFTCLKCSGATSAHCKACYPSATLAGGLPVSSCICIPSYWALAGDTTSCQPCSNRCLECSSASSASCTQCKPHATPTGPLPSSCSCNTSYYLDTGTGDCPACDSTCLNCYSSPASQCYQCKTGAELLGGAPPSTCVCSVQYFPSTTPANCLPCHPTCYLCLSSSSNTCTTCQPHGFIVGGGASGTCNCLGGYFPDPTPALCTICDFTCVLCSGASVMDCTSCYSHTLIQGGGTVGKCVCVSSYWPDPNTTNCQPCDNTCLECVAGNASSCSVCKPHATLSPGPATGSCPCDTGYYREIATGDCLPCDSTCLNCYNSSAVQCNQCKPGAHLISWSAPDGCICSNGFYPSPDASLCPACDPTCLLCSAGTVNGCSACYPFASITGGGAMGACDCFTNYFPDPSPAHCFICDFTCVRCVERTNADCIACFPHAVLYNSLITSNCVCAVSYYPSPDVTSCLPCHNTCLECTSNTSLSCILCKPHATLLSSPGPSECQCDINYLRVVSTGNCRTCDETCRTCSGFEPPDCTSCFPRAELKLAIGPSPCVCKEGFYPLGGEFNCQPCHITCLRCISQSAAECTQCKSFATVVFPPGECQCFPGSYPSPDPSSCLPCFPTCSECIGPDPDQCLRCQSGADVPSPPPSLCICLSGFYPNPDASQCLACPAVCRTCTDGNRCESCNAGAEVMEGGECACERGFYPSPNASNCISCGSNCLTCAETGCLQCMPNYRLFQGQCLTKCPYGETSHSSQCAFPNFLPPVPSLQVQYDNSLLVIFDVPMNCSLLATDIAIEAFDSEKLQLELTWNQPIFTDSESVHIDVQYYEPFIPIGCTVTLAFLSPAEVTDVEGFSIEIASLTGELFPIGQPANSTSLVTSLPITQYTKAVGAAGALGSLISAILTSNSASWLTIFNQYQIVTFLPISALGITKDFAGALAALNTPRMAPSPIANSLSADHPSQQPSAKELNYGIKTTLFLPNIITISLISSAVLLAAVPIYLLSLVSSPALSTYFKSHVPAFRWTIPLTIGLAVYLDMGIYSFIQVKSASFDSAYIGFNTLLGGLGLAAFLFIPVFMASFFYIEYNEITLRTNQTFLKRWKILITPFDPVQKYASFIHYSLYITRRLALSGSILLLTDSPKYVFILNSSISTLIFLYLAIKRPFLGRLDTVESIILEGCTLLIYIETGLFAFDWSSSLSSVLDKAGVATVWLLAVVSTVMPLIRMGGIVVNAVKAAKGTLRVRHLVTTTELVPPGPTRHATFELN